MARCSAAICTALGRLIVLHKSWATAVAGVVLSVSLAGAAAAHPGGLDSSGGHVCRTNCEEWGYEYGQWHSHGGGSAPAPAPDPAPAPEPPPPPPDTKPPGKPKLRKATIDGSSVTLPVRAENGSQVRFAVSGSTVHTITGTGAMRRTSFNLPDGRHKVAVTATDAAGNTSKRSQVTVMIDTTAPDKPDMSLDVEAKPGGETGIALAGEPAARYRIVLNGAETKRESGSLGGNGEATLAWQLPNGDYTVRAVLTDAHGNTSTAAKRAVNVKLPAPVAPQLEVTSDQGETPIDVRAASKGAEEIELSLSESETTTAQETVKSNGADIATATFDVPDGRYTLQAVGVDFQGQRSPLAQEAGVVVDTTPPTMDVTLADDLLGDGIFAFRLRAEAGSSVQIASDTDELAEEFTATGGWQDFQYEVASGEHSMAVTATDEFGNELTEEFTAEVTTPFGLIDWIILAIVLALLVAVGFGVWTLVKRVRLRRAP